MQRRGEKKKKMRKTSRRTVVFVPSLSSSPLLSLRGLAVIAATVVVVAAAATVNSPAADIPRPPSADAGTMTDDDDRDGGDRDGGDGGGGGGGGDGVFPFKALQFYNIVAGYLEYFYDTVIAPVITGDSFRYFIHLPRKSIFLGSRRSGDLGTYVLLYCPHPPFLNI